MFNAVADAVEWILFGDWDSLPWAVKECYARHSFHIGVATTAAECGLQDSLIKALGRWKSLAYQIYIRTPRERLAAVSRTLVSGPSSLNVCVVMLICYYFCVCIYSPICEFVS